MIYFDSILQDILKKSRVVNNFDDKDITVSRGIYLKAGRNYGEYCTDFIEQNALELYYLGKLPKNVEKLVEARNPKTKIFKKQVEEDVKKQWFIASKKGMVKTAKKKLDKKHDYEKIVKNIYEHDLGKKPSKNKHSDFVPLKERRDYGAGGYDTLERNALDLLEEGKLPKELKKQLKTRIKQSFVQLKNI